MIWNLIESLEFKACRPHLLLLLLLLNGRSCLDEMMLQDLGMLFRAECKSTAISPELQEVLKCHHKIDNYI